MKKYVGVSSKLEAFVNPHDCRPSRKPWVVPGWLAAACCCYRRRDRRGSSRPGRAELPGPRWPTAGDEETGGPSK